MKVDFSHLNEQEKTQIGKLKYKSDFFSINLQQYGNTYKFSDKKPEIEFAVTTFQNKGGATKKYKPKIGIDMGIKTSITTSEGEKLKVYVEETERLKKIQRKIIRRKKGSSNRYKARKLLRKEYQKLTNRKPLIRKGRWFTILT